MTTAIRKAFEEKNTKQYLLVKGARTHNLKNIDVIIPRNALVVITGVSGSGKSSLAFDTIYAEGQRKYVESLSAYIRQFVDQMEKPEVDYILGISPAIAIEQKVSVQNARSTVGTMTEIYDYLRLLFARIGQTYSPVSNTIVKSHTVQDVVEYTASLPIGSRVYLTVRNHKKDKKTLAENLTIQLQKGFSRLWYQNNLIEIEEFIQSIDKQKENDYIKGNIYLLIDRTIIKENFQEQINDWADSVNTAFLEGDGELIIWVQSPKDKENSYLYQEFSDRFEADGISFERPTPEFFSFNTAYGACPFCQGEGLGRTYSRDLIIPNPNLSVNEGAVSIWKGKLQEYLSQFIKKAPQYGFDVYKPYTQLTKKEKDILWKGIGKECIGILGSIQEIIESKNIRNISLIEKTKKQGICAACEGTRLRIETDNVKIQDKNLREILQMPIYQVLEWFKGLHLSEYQRKIARYLLIEIESRLEYICQVGLGYLTLHRNANSLSGGETQRINLAKSIGSPLVGSLYILDEPSIGLHPSDNEKLIHILKHLRQLGNTVIVVEHDPEIMKHADYIIDIGKYAGENGGNVVFQGKYNQLLQCKESLTGAYLSGKLSIPVPSKRRIPKQFFTLQHARLHNLKNITVDIPLGCFIAVTGVSGSGKSTLIIDELYENIQYQLEEKELNENYDGDYEYDTQDFEERRSSFTSSIKKMPEIDFIELIDQNPIQRNTRSNVITYTKCYDYIRSVFAQQPLAKQRKYTDGYFSYNSHHGACDVCEGEGYITIDMQFMTDLKLICETCQGKRFKEPILEVTYKDKNIYEVLNLTVDQAIEFFEDKKNILSRLKPLQEVGLGYIRLGQTTDTFSGGELQRLKLASFLIEKPNKKGIYIFDEPTTGLHLHDIDKLIQSLNLLVENGHTVIVIEHNLELIKTVDYIIELGPGAGDKGGHVIFSGTPEEMIKNASSVTAPYLLPLLNNGHQSR